MDIETIAKSLTKAQREATLGAVERRAGRWHVPNAGRVRGKLVEKRLAYLAVPDFAWRADRRDTVLTPLGLAVRAHLSESQS